MIHDSGYKPVPAINFKNKYNKKTTTFYGCSLGWAYILYSYKRDAFASDA